MGLSRKQVALFKGPKVRILLPPPRTESKIYYVPPPSYAKASEGLRPERNLDSRRSVLRSFSEGGLSVSGPSLLRTSGGLRPP